MFFESVFSHGPSSTFWRAGLALLSLPLLLAGCTTAPYCEPLRRCGGDMLAGGVQNAQGVTESEWVTLGPDSCTDQIQVPVVVVSLNQQPSRTAAGKGPGQATVDWCSSLKVNPNGSLQYLPFFPVIPLENARLTFESDGTFLAHFVTAAPEHLGFSASCRAAQGVNWSCAELGRHISVAIRAEANVTNTLCYDDGDGGCLCDQFLRIFTGQPGTWGANDGIVTFYDGSGANLPGAPADYCVKGDSLELTGHAGQQLFNRQGLRTLSLHRPSCSDGIQDGDEKGVDCGGACSTECGTCLDNLQNGDEEGVDCGGSCKDYCGCFNKIQDKWEEGVDCGGPCALPCYCQNGVHDQNEGDDNDAMGIDCGGDCQARFETKDAIACPKK